MEHIDIISPVKNEENNVEELARRIDQTMTSAGISYNLIIIDDNSTDKTAKKVQSLTKKYPIKFAIKKGKPGKAFSILEGMELARSDLVVTIDSDLQYPPEAIPQMISLANYCGIVVANRKIYETTYLRKLGSKLNRFITNKILLGSDCDVQSGLKVFKKEIIDNIEPNSISQWTLDANIVHTANELGYRIGSVDIYFQQRKHGKSKINFFKAAQEIITGNLKIRLTNKKIYQIKPNNSNSLLWAGLAHKKKRFITHTTLPHQQSAFITLTTWQKAFIFLALSLLILGIIINLKTTAIILIALISLIYLIDVVFSFYVLLKSLHFPPEIKFNKNEISKINESKLPIYSILCPLYKEAKILPQFLEAINAIDWPKDKLDVLLLLEEDDAETLDQISSLNLPSYVRPFVVPHSYPKTKPKACNFGLALAKGEYIVIFDAEDRPDPLQLKKSYLAFNKNGSNFFCLQSKLNYFNPHDNLLTKLFTAEYSLWFDIILQGIQSIESSVPLGGTSNHFRTQDLKSLKGWDPFNVTEDCDLGVRIFKKGYKTAIIDSTTYEEANSSVRNWLRQRSRWIKGYFQTYLVHMREPFKFLKNHGIHALLFQLIIGMRMTFMMINPFLWLATFSYFALFQFVGPAIEAIYPAPVFYVAIFSLVFGNFMYLYNYMIGCAKRRHWSIVKFVFFVPFYWLLGSMAAYMAVYQLIRKPHYWEKTHHGLHLKPKLAKSQRFQISINIRIPEEVGKIWDTAVLYLQKANQILLDSFNLPKAVYLKVVVNINSVNGGINGYFKNGNKKHTIDFNRLNSPKLDKLRILIFNWRDTKHVWAGGAEAYLQQMATNWVEEGHEVTLFCGNDGKLSEEENIDGINIIRKGGFYTVYIWAFIYYLFRFRNRFDVIIDSENGVPFFTPLFSRKPKFLLVHHVHQEVFRKHLIFPLSQLAQFIESKLMPFVYKDQKVITVSKSTKRDLENMGFTDPENIEVITPGVDQDKFKLLPKTAYPSFVYLGRHKPYKNIDVAIKAFAQLAKTRPDAKLSIAGEGEGTEQLKQLALKLSIEKQVTFLGKISEAEKAKLFAQSWVALQPSSFEGWGLTVIEANAAGTPVIASGVKGLQDSIIHGETGLLFQVHNIDALKKAMEWIITYPSARLEMSQQAYEWSKQFNWNINAYIFLRIMLNELEKSQQPIYIREQIATRRISRS